MPTLHVEKSASKGIPFHTMTRALNPRKNMVQSSLSSTPFIQYGNALSYDEFLQNRGVWELLLLNSN